MLTVALVHSQCLDCGNAVLIGVQLIYSVVFSQCAAAWLSYHLGFSDHITDALVSLHWLLVPERITHTWTTHLCRWCVQSTNTALCWHWPPSGFNCQTFNYRWRGLFGCCATSLEQSVWWRCLYRVIVIPASQLLQIFFFHRCIPDIIFMAVLYFLLFYQTSRKSQYS